ncbi:TPA: replication endonuclease [Enterobacter cloacae]|nr:replication endonuclease [Enterobacter cloacae]
MCLIILALSSDIGKTRLSPLFVRVNITLLPTIFSPFKAVFLSPPSTSSQQQNRNSVVSPHESQRYLNQIWQQIRAELARREISVFGLPVADSHHDGTPH